MGGSRPLRSESKTSRLLEPQLVAPKKRKMAQRVVITVQMEANNIKQKNEGPPSDCWSWRKYGQKPIKGSPYPRGYYKCSTSKGCSAKKQVERSSTDASLFIVTYTSTHNHPGPNFPSSSSNNDEPNEESPNNPVTQDKEPIMDQHVSLDDNDDPQILHYCKSPSNSTSISQDILIQQEENSLTDNLGTVSYDDLPLSYPQLMNFPKSDLSEENDFYDELGELQLPPSSTSFAGIFEEAILVDPSY